MKFLLPAVLCGAVLMLRAADFPQIYNSEPGNPEPTSAEAALKMLHLPEGFKATLYAAEPDVQNPIAMAWDHRGRMWVAENYTYAEPAKRFDLELRDRVLILEDADHDGRAEKRTVFTDNVQMLTSVEVGRGGVWLMCPPQLLFVPDADANDIPDGPAQVMLDGFTVAQNNYHNFANGLRWGPDGWLYGRCGHSCPGRVGVPGTPDAKRIPNEGGMWRFHPERKVFEMLTHGTTNPWGHDWDENGECFFINTVIGHLWHLIPGAHLRESFGADLNEAVYERIDQHADHYHFDTTGKWMDSRDGKANSFGGGHAHIGMMIYQADQWPADWRNKLYTLNMHGRRANVERLERAGSGYVGKHEPDVFLTDDTWFRGMEITTGADGSGYLLDWSDVGECHEHTGMHRTSGRIYRISYGEAKKPDLTDLQTPTADGLLRCLRHGNAWFDRQMRQRLADMAVKSALPEDMMRTCQGVLAGQQGPLRLRALWMLHACGMLKQADLLPLVESTDEHMRVWALRLLTDQWPLDTILGLRHDAVASVPEEVLAALVAHAKEDTSALVRLGIASAVKRLPLVAREQVLPLLLAHVEDGEDHNLPFMIWYGMIPVLEQKPELLSTWANVCTWAQVTRWMARYAASHVEKRPAVLDGVLTALKDAPPALVSQAVAGISDAMRGSRKAAKPAAWESFAQVVSANADAATQSMLTDLGAVFGDGMALDKIRQVALDEAADIQARRAAVRTMVEARPEDLRTFCETLLEVRTVALEAVNGLAVFDDPSIGQKVASRFRRFPAAERPQVMAVLVSRPAWAKAMLSEMGQGKILKTDLTPFHVRQLTGLGDAELTAQLEQVWGALRESSAEKKAALARWQQELTPATLAKADLGRGRLMFQGMCASCHKMYGEGAAVGPDLTGSGRAHLDYLLENLLDPSAVVPADYQMKVLTLTDGRTLSGIVSRQTGKAVTLRTLTEEMTLPRAEVKEIKPVPVSMMPEGLLQNLPPEMARDLIAYLMHPGQVPLPKP
jgi:putative membrane-bound dehydrogenase-like protein